MHSFLRLIRYKNLIIIAVTQYLMRYCIVRPILQINGFELQLSNFHFLLLVISSILITAAGYVINDYFDTKTDIINRPGTVIIGKKISRRQAMFLHIMLNILGVGIGIYLSFRIGVLAMGVAYLLATGVLWFYSTTYKRQFLIGNLIVAIFTAIVPFVVVIFEVPLLIGEYREVLISHNMNFNNIIAWVGGFSFFAFSVTLVREIIKDLEDFEGDMAFGRNTLPIYLGVKTTKSLIVLLISGNIAAILFVYFRFLIYTPESRVDYISMIYFLVFLVIPFIYLGFSILKAKSNAQYHRASNLVKIIMLFGILYAVVAYYIITTSF